MSIIELRSAGRTTEQSNQGATAANRAAGAALVGAQGDQLVYCLAAVRPVYLADA